MLTEIRSRFSEELDFMANFDTFINFYSERAHFVFELLQNAEDAEASQARFVLRSDVLYFMHNGRTFDLTDPNTQKSDSKAGIRVGDINSITTLSKSQKRNKSVQDDKPEYYPIGKFGVGFKALYIYTSSPKIYTGDFRFCLNSVIIPTWVEEDLPGRQPEITVFEIPLGNEDADFVTEKKNSKDAFGEIRDRLETLEFPNLFLKNLSRVEFLIEEENGFQGTAFTKEIKIDFWVTQKLSINRNNLDDLFLFSANSGFEDTVLVSLNFRVFTENVNLDGREYPTFLAIPVEYFNGTLIIENPVYQPIYSFFPTGIGTSSLLYFHGPFELKTDRDGIRDSDSNKLIMKAFYRLQIKGVDWLAEQNWLTSKTWEYLPVRLTNDQPAAGFKPDELLKAYLYQSLVDGLRKHKKAWLPTRSDGYVTAEVARIRNARWMSDLFSDSQLTDLFKRPFHFVFSDSDQLGTNSPLNIFLDKKSGVRFIEQDQYLSAFIENPEFMYRQPEEWLWKFYNIFPSGNAPAWKVGGDMMKAPVFRMASGKFKALRRDKETSLLILKPTDAGAVMYPDNTVDPLFWREYTQADDEIGKLKYSVSTFFRGLPLKETDQFNQIRHEFKWLLSESENQEITPKYADEVFRFWKTVVEQKIDVEQLREEYKDRKLIPLAVEDKVEFWEVEYAFLLTEEYERFWEVVETGWLMNVAFFEDRGIDWHFFEETFLRFGVKKVPGLCSIHGKFDENTVTDFLDDLGIQYRTWDPISETNWKEIPDFETFVKSISSEADCTLLWDILKKNSDSYLHFATAKYEYYGTNSFALPYSPTADVLMNNAWIWHQDQLRKPSELFLKDLQKKPLYFDYQQFPDLKILLEGLDFKESDLNADKLKKLFVDADLTEEDVFHLIRLKELSRRAAEISDGEISNEQALDEYLSQLSNELEGEFDRKQKEEERSANLEKPYTLGWLIALCELEVLASNRELNETRKRSFPFQQVNLGENHKIILKSPAFGVPDLLERFDGDTLNIRISRMGESRSSWVPIRIDSLSLVQGNVHVRPKQLQDVQNLVGAITLHEARLDVGQPTVPDQVLLKRLDELKRQLGIDYNLQENLPPNIRFVFGPPGTGKTQHLAFDEIIPYIKSNPNAKILVLTPTNKACDVLAKRVLMASGKDLGDKEPDWLIRFGTFIEPELNHFHRTRENNYPASDALCLVTTTTRYLYDGFEKKDGEIRYRLKDQNSFEWDKVIIDEASMVNLAEVMYIIYNLQNQDNIPEIIIAGDPKQLGPVYLSGKWNETLNTVQGEEMNIYALTGLTVFNQPVEWKTVNQYSVLPLQTQFRAVPKLGEVFSSLCYEKSLGHSRINENVLVERPLTIGGKILSENTSIPFLVSDETLALFPIKQGSSWYHPYAVIAAVELAIKLASQIAATWPNLDSDSSENEVYTQEGINKSKYSIGIISPYAAQARVVNSLIGQLYTSTKVSITAGTVHGFQGDDCNVIIMVLNSPKSIRSNIMGNRLNLLNVAQSRAKDYFILLESSKLLAEQNATPNFAKLKRLLKANGEQTISALDLELELFKKPDVLQGYINVHQHNQVNIYHTVAEDSVYEFRSDQQFMDVAIDPVRRQDLLDGRLDSRPVQTELLPLIPS